MVSFLWRGCFLNLVLVWSLFVLSTQAQAEQVKDTESQAAAQTADTLPVVDVYGGVQTQGPFLTDVGGTKIYSGKKTNLVSLSKDAPALTNNNYRQALAKVPGLLLSEESTPLFSVGYRGLDPHRGQFMQMMKDGIPIHADMFGYPEAYYTPILQSIETIEFVRGGAGLMYGPQPGGALNYVSKMPRMDTKFSAYSENVFGSDQYFSTYESLSGSLGPAGYQAYFHEREGNGFREANSDYEVIASGFTLTLFQDTDTRLKFFYDEYHEEHGEPGGLSLSATTNLTYEQDRTATTRFNDRFKLERYYGGLILEKELSDITQLDFRLYGGHYRRWSKRQRGGGFGTVPTGATSNSNDIEEQDFYNIGFEPRIRHDYELFGENHTLTLGSHSFFSRAPRVDERGASPTADTGSVRKVSERDSSYFSVFLENLFRWGQLKVTPGVRLEHFWQSIEEKVNLDKTTVPLADESEFDFAPLFGLGVAYEIAKAVEVYTNYSQSYRPKVFTQAVPNGTNQVVNQDLEEGKAWQYDVGLRGSPRPYLHWDTSYFILDFDDQIGTVGSTVQNVGNARHHGLEFAADLDVIGAFDALENTNHAKTLGSLSPFFVMTLIDAEFQGGPSEGRQPAYAPKYNLRTGLNYKWHERVSLNFFGTFLGDHFADDNSTLNRKIPSYKVWDLTGEVNLVRNAFDAFDVSVFGGINNIFNEEYYARIRSDGIDPAYGRNVYGGVKIALG